MRFLIPLLLLTVVTQADETNLLASADLARLKPFRATFELGKQTLMEGSPPEHWSFPAPDPFTSGEIFLSKDDVAGAKAFALRKSEGPSPMQFRCDGIQLSAGKSYTLSFDYLTTGGSGAVRLMVDRQQRDKTPSLERALSDTGGEWKSASIAITPRQNAQFEVQLHCYSGGPDKGIYFKNLSLRTADNH